MKRIAIFILMSLPQIALSEALLGRIYKKGSGRETALFIQEMRIEKSGTSEVHKTVIQANDETKETAFSDELTLESGRFQRYSVEHRQLKERWTAEHRDGRIHFAKEDLSSGKIKRDDEKMRDDLIVGPMVVPHILENWQKLEQGKSVEIRLGVLQRLETIGFKFVSGGRSEFASQKVVKILMKPTNFVISALVDPIEFYFTEKDHRLIYTVGRTQLRYLENGEWKDLVAETVFAGAPGGRPL